MFTLYVLINFELETICRKPPECNWFPHADSLSCLQPASWLIFIRCYITTKTIAEQSSLIFFFLKQELRNKTCCWLHRLTPPSPVFQTHYPTRRLARLLNPWHQCSLPASVTRHGFTCQFICNWWRNWLQGQPNCRFWFCSGFGLSRTYCTWAQGNCRCTQ